MDMKETIINECLNVLHRKEVKDEFKELMRPLIDMLVGKYILTFLINYIRFISFY